MSERDSRDREQWHLSKGVPVALIITLIVQSATIVWWASDINSRVAQLESRAVDAARLAVLEERITAMKETLGRIEDMLSSISADRFNRSNGGSYEAPR